MSLALRFVWAPVRVLSGAAAVGRDRAKTGGTLPLLVFGALDLVNFVLQPALVSNLPSGQTAQKGSEAGLLLLSIGVIAVGIAVLPNFTLSVTGVAVLMGSVVVSSAQTFSIGAQRNWTGDVVRLIY